MQQQINHLTLEALTRDMSEMKELMSRLVDAVNRIAILDERQNTTATMLAKLDEKTIRMEIRQQESEIHRAVSQASQERMTAMDAVVREMHVERERDKARFQTVVWMVRALWAVVTTGGIGVMFKLFGGGA